jgi:cellobiose phosphorylase
VINSEARSDPHELLLTLEVTAGQAVSFLITHHVALNDDDGSAPGAALWKRNGPEIEVSPARESDLERRFPNGTLRITAMAGTGLQRVGGDELLFGDGRSRQQPFICIVTAPASRVGLSIRGNLISEARPAPLYAQTVESLTPKLTMDVARAGPPAEQLARLAEIAPWYAQNALVHYLAPRGLEQYSGGGWGTRDVCQGPVELLLALDQVKPIRDLLLRVMRAQNPDGDWPQWFMFFERERGIRAADSHGDIVFWPLVVLAQYLVASGDAGVLEDKVPFFDSRGPDAGEPATVWQHAQRALALIEKRVIPGTALAAYGHGDWNDSLQPADPAMRERLCSAWTVTLHYQTLASLAGALRSIGRAQEADSLEKSAAVVQRDFQRLLVVDGVLAGYALFESGKQVRYLLHPSDTTTGVQYSSLAMIHAILEDLLTPAQAREHLKLIEMKLSTPEGVRLFDRPMPYHGGLQRLFQRAETATYFGREIGLMYMHAHLRYAQALAHVGEAERFFHALCQANPIGIRSIVPAATLRQANCYYSSSDAAFADRYQASEQYECIANGTIALEGGWRVYSSGAGIALGLIIRRFLGLSREAGALRVDPVIPATLDGLRVDTTFLGRPVEVRYRIKGPGFGVNKIALNEANLPFHDETNPYRRGAALISLSSVLERLRPEANILSIDLGRTDS